MNCIVCKNLIILKPGARNATRRRYCSSFCRTRYHNRKCYANGGAERQRVYVEKQREKDTREKIQCQLCGKWFRQVGSHVWERHNMLARDYRIMFGFDRKRGQLPTDLREHKADKVFENGTVDNLKLGKAYWFKEGSSLAGRYERSQQTMERLRKGTRVK